jgi:hypothetical protein
VNCHDLDRWLEDGEPDSRLAAVRAHALACPRCAARLRAHDELERALARAPGRAPDGFVTQVMASVAGTRQVRGRVPLLEVLPLFQTVPWWTRVAFDPAAILATLVVSLLLWRGNALLTLASSEAAQLVAWLAQWAHAAPPVSSAAVVSIWLQPVTFTCIALAAVPLVLMSSRLLYDWSAHLVGPRPTRAFGR